MQQIIKLDNLKCIGCEKCVIACPALIFSSKDKTPPVIDKIDRCIVCGHCVAICPTNAISHIEFPDSKVHDINHSILPSPEAVLEIIKSRRSNRMFTDDPIPQDSLSMIIEAAHRAPTATNLQKVYITVVNSPEKLSEVSQFTANTFYSIACKLENPLLKPLLKRVIGNAYRYVPTFKRMKSELEKGNDMILKGANIAIFFHSPSSVMFGKEDCNLAYQNASLMAESLGIAHFYTGFVCSASNRTKHKKLATILEIRNNVVHAGMALGMPLHKFKKYIDKLDLIVNYI